MGMAALLFTWPESPLTVTTTTQGLSTLLGTFGSPGGTDGGIVPTLLPWEECGLRLAKGSTDEVRT